MRRILAHLVTAAAAFSLVVAATATALAIRSYRVSDLFLYNRPDWSAFVETADGEFRLEHTRVVDLRFSNPAIGFEHRSDKVDGAGLFPDRLPGQWLHFRRFGFAFVTGARWNDYAITRFLRG